MRRRAPRITRACFAAVVGSMLLLPAEAWSQGLPEAAPVTVGSRVRILAPTAFKGRVEGLIIEMDDKSLLLGINDRVPLRISRQAITELDVSMGQHRHALKGAIIGVGVALAMSGFIALATRSDQGGNSQSGGAYFGLTLASGAIWGAGIGALSKGDRWSTVPLEKVRVSLGPTRGHGFKLSVSLGF